ncbi:MAG: alanine racemase [Patescibacteria group bacterium]|nr:alanine racemase [Patescibacteria group bacterium]
MIEILKNNLVHNIKEFKKITNASISGVIKANAYGHGDKEVINILNPYVDYFQINSFEELKRIRKYTKKPILLLGYIGKDKLKKAMELGCILSVFDFSHALLINKISIGKQKIHIAVDSYLGREGIMPEDVNKFIAEVSKMENIIIDGVYSHFANIEDTSNFSHAQKQINQYKKVVKIFKKKYPKIKTHISATSGLLVYEKNKKINDIVRIGIGLYGMWPSKYLEKENNINLKPIIRWTTNVAQIKNLPKNYSIGYGLSYKTKKETKIAVIPQGYSDGYSRLLSNKGEVLIKGKRASIIGRIAMNMFVADVSKIKNVEVNDEVVILGDKITAEELAKKTDTINYEVTTRISPFIPRKIV